MSQNRGSKGSFSHKAPVSATDLRCYFQCVEVFKKDYDLRIHLKIRHRGEDEKELEKAYQAAEEEIALVRRSACTFQCALCPKKFGDRGSFGGLVKLFTKLPGSNTWKSMEVARWNLLLFNARFATELFV